MGKMSKAVRIRRMLSKGASVEQIAKATGSSKPYIYTVNMKMKKDAQEKKWATIEALAKTGITPLKQPVDLAQRDEVSLQYKADIKAHIDALNNFNKPTLWQRIKSLFGF
jgi:hypothetical protein